MVLHLVDLRSKHLPGEQLCKLVLDAGSLALVANPVQDKPDVGSSADRVCDLPPQIRARVLIDRDVIYAIESNSRFV